MLTTHLDNTSLKKIFYPEFEIWVLHNCWLWKIVILLQYKFLPWKTKFEEKYNAIKTLKRSAAFGKFQVCSHKSSHLGIWNLPIFELTIFFYIDFNKLQVCSYTSSYLGTHFFVFNYAQTFNKNLKRSTAFGKFQVCSHTSSYLGTCSTASTSLTPTTAPYPYPYPSIYV